MKIKCYCMLLHACARKYVNNWSVIGQKKPQIVFLQ